MSTHHNKAFMKARLIQSREDLEMIAHWWEGHRAHPVPFTLLPSTGLIIEDRGEPLLAGWLYIDKSVNLGFLAWITSNPGSSPFRVSKALRILTGAAEALMAAKDGACVTVVTNSSGLKSGLEGQGYETFQHHAYQLIKTKEPTQ